MPADVSQTQAQQARGVLDEILSRFRESLTFSDVVEALLEDIDHELASAFVEKVLFAPVAGRGACAEIARKLAKSERLLAAFLLIELRDIRIAQREEPPYPIDEIRKRRKWRKQHREKLEKRLQEYAEACECLPDAHALPCRTTLETIQEGALPLARVLWDTVRSSHTVAGAIERAARRTSSQADAHDCGYPQVAPEPASATPSSDSPPTDKRPSRCFREALMCLAAKEPDLSLRELERRVGCSKGYASKISELKLLRQLHQNRKSMRPCGYQLDDGRIEAIAE